jgi:hypothetical protein
MSRIIFIIKKQFPYNKPVARTNIDWFVFHLIKEPLREATLIVFSFAHLVF